MNSLQLQLKQAQLEAIENIAKANAIQGNNNNNNIGHYIAPLTKIKALNNKTRSVGYYFSLHCYDWFGWFFFLWFFVSVVVLFLLL